jgi:hypothetical protein
MQKIVTTSNDYPLFQGIIKKYSFKKAPLKLDESQII